MRGLERRDVLLRCLFIFIACIVLYAGLRNYCSCPEAITEQEKELILEEEVKEVQLREALDALDNAEKLQKQEEQFLESRIHELTEERKVTDTYCGVNGMLLVSMKRSGTTFFCSLLSNHPQLASLGVGQEVLDSKHNRYYSTVFNTNITTLEPIPTIILEFIMAKVGVGFVLMGGNQINSQNGQTLLTLAQNYSVIHLVRKNVLRMHISDKLAERISSSHCYAGGDCRNFSGVKFSLPTKGLVKLLEAKSAIQDLNRKYIQERKMKNIEISYEDLSEDPVKIVTKCLDFLQCSHLRPDQYVSNLVKRGASDLRDELDNFDEVRETLKGTRFEQMLFDP
eukprot:TRINITY_DN2268_c0_g1_i1.p1 TRINITY_DN2268_c0_g1~~TRINITY_DN2268_c0_g1_i1.p1  ORF type:complete len:339 (+),score=88.61 TRINITY_DN2268_c0_g1_i1:141-1157(+)